MFTFLHELRTYLHVCRTCARVSIRAGERLRVHQQPRRYRDGCWLGAEAWRRRIVYSDEEIFVVNKPSRQGCSFSERRGKAEGALCPQYQV
jgi:23S rRNA-/tRNA-specific pseudouridylate synthase